MGLKYGMELPNTFHGRSFLGSQNYSSQFQSGSIPTNKGGSPETCRYGTRQEAGFHSTLFLVPKKAGGQRSVIKMKVLNCFIWTYRFNQRCTAAQRLADKSQMHNQRCTAAQRLADKSRYERCIFHVFDTPGSQEVFILHSMGFHQVPQAGNSFCEGTRMVGGYVLLRTDITTTVAYINIQGEQL